MKTSDVLEWMQSCINEAESNGYEVGQSLVSMGEKPGWMEGQDCLTPTIVYLEGAKMKVALPDGSECMVAVSKIRKGK